MLELAAQSPGEVSRIVQTIAGVQSSHGGTSRSVPALCESLSRAGLDVHLVTGRPANRSIESNQPAEPVRTHWIEESAWTGRYLTGHLFRNRLRQVIANRTADVILHDHGLWLPSNHAVARFASSARLQRVVSPRGMLSDWAMRRGRLKKSVAWRTWQRADLTEAIAFHATSQGEAADIRSAGLDQPIAILPNGITLPSRMSDRIQSERRRMLFLSRIHPKKGLENLVRAFARVCLDTDWELVVAGPGDENYRMEVQRLVDQLGLTNRVSIRDAIADHAKWDLYASSELFVLPSYSENFGIAVAEALAAGVPVITTTATPWSGLKERRVGWWVEPTLDGIEEAMSQAIRATTMELAEMGARASTWVRSEFQWDSIGVQFSEFYQWLLTGGSKPRFVV